MAQVDYFLKLDGIAGESQDEKHKGEIDIESWSFSEYNQAEHDRGGAGTGKVSVSDLSLMTKLSKASPLLFKACASGQHIKTAVLSARKAGKTPQEYFKVTLTDAFVTSYQVSGAGGGAVTPNESLSINFAKIEYEYKEQKADGSLGGTTKASYDVKQNKTA